MKINPIIIVRDHLDTLRDYKTGKPSLFDFMLFFAVPIILGGSSIFLCVKMKGDIYNVSITFFGIFIALLLNIQVAIFAILQRKPEPPTDPKLAELEKRELDIRRNLLGELNANLSYLVLFCCLALIVFLGFYVTDSVTSDMATAATTLVYTHFLLTLLMVVKRSHALFQREYTRPGG